MPLAHADLHDAVELASCHNCPRLACCFVVDEGWHSSILSDLRSCQANGQTGLSFQFPYADGAGIVDAMCADVSSTDLMLFVIYETLRDARAVAALLGPSAQL